MKNRVGSTLVPALATLVLFLGIIAAQTAPTTPPATVVNPKIPRLSDVAGGQDPKLIKDLRKGGYVIFFRHCVTDWTQRDTDYSNFENRAGQRNLSDEGKAQAAAIGKAFQELGIPFDSVFVSPMWRCRDTAQLAFGRFVVKQALFGKVPQGAAATTPAPSAERAEYRTERVAMLSTKPIHDENRILVGQQDPMIPVIPGLHRDELREGDALVVQPEGNGKFKVVVQVTSADWTRLATEFTTKK